MYYGVAWQRLKGLSLWVESLPLTTACSTICGGKMVQSPIRKPVTGY